jgi:DNA gyrase subunit A
MGRSARGVRGIRLKGDDYVVGVVNVVEDKKLVTITENGFGKRTDFDDFRLMKNRGGGGVICHNLTEKTGLLAGIISVSDDDDVMMITDKGTIIRMSVSDINVYSRTAGGVIVMRTSEDNRIITLSRLEKIEELEEIAEAENEKIIEENKNAETKAPETERASLDEEESF